MSNPPVGFGDNVRVLATPDTERIGVAGLIGQVYGHTTPSATGVDVVGEVSDDFAVNVHFDELHIGFWFAVELLEFVDHGAGTQIKIAGVAKQWTRHANGEWAETDTDAPVTKRGFSRLFKR